MQLKALLLGIVLASSVYAGDWFAVQIEAPVYPILANQARIEGEVRLMLTFDKAGVVSSVDIVSGQTVLARAAQDNIKLWKFAEPGSNTQKAPRSIEFTYDFRLEGEVEANPKTRFRYEHPYKAMVVSQALHWMPDKGQKTR